MSTRNKFIMIVAVIFVLSLGYYFISTPSSRDLVLIGTVDSNQVIVSPQVEGRIQKLLVEEGTQVKQGDLIAILDPSELEAEERAAAATIDSLKYKVAETQSTSVAMQGSTRSSVGNARPSSPRFARSCFSRKLHWRGLKVTAGAPLNSLRQAFLPIRNACRRKPISPPRKRSCNRCSSK